MRRFPPALLCVTIIGALWLSACGGGAAPAAPTSATPKSEAKTDAKAPSTTGATAPAGQASPAAQAASPTGPVPAPAADAIEIRVATATVDPGFPYNLGVNRWNELLLTRTNGKVKLTLLPGTLGSDERALAESVRLGTLDALVTSTGPLISFYPNIGVLDLWFLWRDQDHVTKVLQGPIGDELIKGFGDHGYEAVWWYAGFLDLMSGRPIRTPEDLAGQKIRVQQTKVDLEYMKALGGNPTPMAYGEVYGALQQRVLDGALSSLSAMQSAKWHEVQKNVSLVQAKYAAAPVLFSKTKLATLPPDLRQALLDTCKEAAASELEFVASARAKDTETMRAAGVQFIEVDRTPFITKAKAADPIFEADFGKDLIDRIRNAS